MQAVAADVLGGEPDLVSLWVIHGLAIAAAFLLCRRRASFLVPFAVLGAALVLFLVDRMWSGYRYGFHVGHWIWLASRGYFVQWHVLAAGSLLAPWAGALPGRGVPNRLGLAAFWATVGLVIAVWLVSGSWAEMGGLFASFVVRWVTTLLILPFGVAGLVKIVRAWNRATPPASCYTA